MSNWYLFSAALMVDNILFFVKKSNIKKNTIFKFFIILFFVKKVISKKTRFLSFLFYLIILKMNTKLTKINNKKI
jgi:hypothetical protein